jgi:hypothetical protein
MNTSARSAFANHLLIYTLVAIGFGGTIGVGTVWMQHEIALVAKANKEIEASIQDCERKSEQLTTEIAEEQDVSVLLERNTRWKLGLVPPSQDNKHDVDEDPVAWMARKHNRELFTDLGVGGSPAPVSLRGVVRP